MFSIEKEAAKFFGEGIEWKHIDDLMSWATDNRRWFTMSMHEIKEVYESKVSDANKIPKNASAQTGLKQIQTAYFQYYLGEERMTRKKLMKQYYTRS